MKRSLLIFFIILISFSVFAQEKVKVFPNILPEEKPVDLELSAATSRMYDQWNPHEDRGNELFSNFKYSHIKGLNEEGVSRRDPTKVIKVDGIYHVWYTHRETMSLPMGFEKANDEIPSVDWDLAEIWHASSKDGYEWKEHGPAFKRPGKGKYGWRSNCTPGVLVWKGKYYIYFQAYSVVLAGGDYCTISIAKADSPFGPWRVLGKPILEPGAEKDWDSGVVHDPCPIVHNDKIFLYFKGGPGKNKNDNTLIRAQGLAIANNPSGLYTKSKLNPVINSGHEVCVWPFETGVAALIALDGPEKNTIQYSSDGENFEIKSLIQIPPIAPGPYIADAFTNTNDGKGFTWGICFVNPKGGGSRNKSKLIRFDCDLSTEIDLKIFKKNNIRFNEETYFQNRIKMTQKEREFIDKKRKSLKSH